MEKETHRMSCSTLRNTYRQSDYTAPNWKSIDTWVMGLIEFYKIAVYLRLSSKVHIQVN